MDDSQYNAAIAYAQGRGRDEGRAATSWFFDGNTSRETYARVLRGIEEGDPVILDTLPTADLSGQHADTTTGPSLVEDALREAGMSGADIIAMPDYDGAFSDICDAYDGAFSTAVDNAITTAARYHLRGEE